MRLTTVLALSSFGSPAVCTRGVASPSVIRRHHLLAFDPPHHRQPTKPTIKYHSSSCIRSMTSNFQVDGDNMDQEIEVPPLRYLGDERLMQPQPAVTKTQLASKEFQQNLSMLPLAMKKYGGIGIAAPQVGWWTRAFCFGIDGTNPRYPNANELPLTMWINPQITWSSKETNWMWEGCLSVPGMRGWVERPCSIILEGWDETGNEREPKKLSGLAARIAQHEFDHLDGVLFPQCVPGKEFLVPQASIEARDGWAKDWPSRGSHRTQMGELCDEK